MVLSQSKMSKFLCFGFLYFLSVKGEYIFQKIHTLRYIQFFSSCLVQFFLSFSKECYGPSKQSLGLKGGEILIAPSPIDSDI